MSRAIIEVVSKLSNQESKATASRIKSMIKHLLPLISNYVKDTINKKDCLKAMEEYTLSNVKQSTSVPILVHIISYLYEVDVIDEDSILNWFNSAEPIYSLISEFDHDEKEQKVLRSHSIMLKFINWLKEAEEESESE